MKRLHPGHAVLLTVLLVYGLLFVLLSVDIMARVWDWRDRLEPLDAAVLFFFEGLRTLVTLAGIAVTVLALNRARASAPLLRLAYALAFTTIACAKLYAYDGFPGAAQEHVARALLNGGVPPRVLQVVFGYWQWAAWLAAAAFVLLVAAWPRRLTSGDVRAPGEHDRAGALRSIALAGADVGSMLRGWTAALVRRGWLEPLYVIAAAVAGAALHTALLITMEGAAEAAVSVIAITAAGLGASIGVTLFRAGCHVADEAERPFMVWLRRAALSALALLTLSAVAALIGAGLLSTASLLLAPAAVFVCIARAVVRVTAR